MKRLPTYSTEVLNSHRLCCQAIVKGRLEELLRHLFCFAQRQYLRRITKFVFDEDGFVTSADKLKEFVLEIEDNWYDNKSEVPEPYQKVNEKLWGIFNYDGFAERKGQGKKGGGIPLIKEILRRIKYCPYCNADMVYTLKCDDTGKTYKSAFDHFYARWRYPFLALSLYNLIPSCDRCNSKFKLDKYKETLETFHPYLDDVDSETHFILSGLTNEMRCGSASADGLKIELMPKSAMSNSSEVSIQNYQALFRINDVYSQLYQGRAIEILQLGELINESYQEEAKERFARAGIYADPIRLILGTPLRRKEINMHHISKLKLDLLEKYCHVKIGP